MLDSLIIRNVHINDFTDISKIRKMPGVIEYILTLDNESPEKIKNKIKAIQDANEIWKVVEINGAVIAVAILNKLSGKRSHCANITIMVNPNFHSIGIGSALMDKLLEYSNNILKVKKVELSVFSNNNKAIKLYKKYGFSVEGIKRQAVFVNNEFKDEIFMAKFI